MSPPRVPVRAGIQRGPTGRDQTASGANASLSDYPIFIYRWSSEADALITRLDSGRTAIGPPVATVGLPAIVPLFAASASLNDGRCVRADIAVDEEALQVSFAIGDGPRSAGMDLILSTAERLAELLCTDTDEN